MALLFHHRTTSKSKTFKFTITNPSLFHRVFSVGGGGGDQPPTKSNTPFSSYFRDIKESLKQQKPSYPSSAAVPTGNSDLRTAKKPGGKFSLHAIRESLQKMNAEPGNGTAGRMSLPESVSGREMRRNRFSPPPPMKTEFVKMYGYVELGEKLRKLRPEGKEFSIRELNERLIKLRKMEENESLSTVGGASFKDLRESLNRLKNSPSPR